MRLISALACACALAACSTGGGAPPPPPPPTKILTGAHVQPLSGGGTEQQFTDFDASVGNTMTFDSVYPNMAWTQYYADRAIWDEQANRIPMFVVAPHIGKTCIKLSAIPKGAADAQIDADAHMVNQGALFIQLFPEMTNSGMLCAYDNGVADPAVYIPAFRYVVARFRADGATNVKFNWEPGQPAFDSGIAWKYYPGDDVVDYQGEHVYNATGVAKPFAAAICQQHTKPFIIGETGAFNTDPIEQAEWISTIAYCVPYAAIYFEAVGPAGSYLITTPDGLSALKDIAGQ